jgi:type I restriction enzyme S subunit
MTEPFSVAENVIPFDPAPDVDPYFLYQLLRGQISTTEYKRHWTELMSKEVLLPPILLCQAFMKHVKPLYQQMSVLQAQIRKLEASRTMLLPRLISGKLRIDHLDIQYPPSMKAELAEAD